MNKYPIFVEYKLPIMCTGFVAGVTVRGRVLLVEEAKDEWWAYGINPGGICGEAKDLNSAVAVFYERFQSVLFDLADEGKSFADFKAAVEHFVNDTNEEFEKDWQAAREQIRKGAVADLPDMRRETAEVKHSVRVKEIKQPAPTDNPSPRGEVTLAVASKAA